MPTPRLLALRPHRRPPPEPRARAAHALYVAHLQDIATTTAAQMQEAMQRAKTSAKAIPEIQEAEAQGRAQGAALLAKIETRFGCRPLQS